MFKFAFHYSLANNSNPGHSHTLRALALERAWAGGEAAASLAAQAAAALPPPPLPAALERAASAAHHLLHQYLQVLAGRRRYCRRLPYSIPRRCTLYMHIRSRLFTWSSHVRQSCSSYLLCFVRSHSSCTFVGLGTLDLTLFENVSEFWSKNLYRGRDLRCIELERSQRQFWRRAVHVSKRRQTNEFLFGAIYQCISLVG